MAKYRVPGSYTLSPYPYVSRMSGVSSMQSIVAQPQAASPVQQQPPSPHTPQSGPPGRSTQYANYGSAFYGYWSTSDLNDIGIASASKKSVIRAPSSTTSSCTESTPRSSGGRKLPDYLAWRRLHVSKAKLAGVGEIATFLAGFAVVATVELQINDDANPILLIAFTVTTALLVTTTMLSIMISTCILPHITVVSKVGHPDAAPHESPHEHMRFFIDLSWVLANTISIFLFTLDVILLSWIKYTYFSVAASISATIIMIPVLLGILVFGILFYRKLLQHQSSIMKLRYEELEEMKRQIDMVECANSGLTQHV